MIPTKYFVAAVTEFLSSEVMPKLSGVAKWTGYALLALGAPSIEKALKHPLLIATGAVTEDSVDVDKLLRAAESAMDKAGNLEIYGIVFDKEAVQQLAACAKKYVK